MVDGWLLGNTRDNFCNSRGSDSRSQLAHPPLSWNQLTRCTLFKECQRGRLPRSPSFSHLSSSHVILLKYTEEETHETCPAIRRNKLGKSKKWSSPNIHTIRIVDNPEQAFRNSQKIDERREQSGTRRSAKSELETNWLQDANCLKYKPFVYTR